MGLLFERGVGLDHGRGAWLGQFAIAMCPFTFLLFAIRLSYRTKVASGLGVDDYITCFAWVTLLATNILAASAIAHGYGRHAKMLTVTDLEWASRLFYAMQILYKLALYSTKTSILALYDRIFVSNTDRTFLGVPANFQTICRTTVVIMAMYTVASVSATLAQCTPFSRIFDKAISGHCINVSAFWIANGVTNILTDIWIIALPQWQVWKLKLPLRQKISLMAVFGLGVSVTAMSILRLTTLGPSAHNLQSLPLDLNYGTFTSTMWTVLEVNVAFVCANLPMLRLPLAMMFPRLRGALGRTGGVCGRGEEDPFHDRNSIVRSGVGAVEMGDWDG